MTTRSSRTLRNFENSAIGSLTCSSSTERSVASALPLNGSPSCPIRSIRLSAAPLMKFQLAFESATPQRNSWLIE